MWFSLDFRLYRWFGMARKRIPDGESFNHGIGQIGWNFSDPKRFYVADFSSSRRFLTQFNHGIGSQNDDLQFSWGYDEYPRQWKR